MSKKTYDYMNFKTEYAIKYGVLEAIILSHIEYVTRDIQHPDYFKDGRYWYRKTINSFCDQLPFASKRTIERALKKLVDSGALIKGKFNKHFSDQTNWYALPELIQEPQFGPIDDVNLSSQIKSGCQPDIPTKMTSSSYNKDITKELTINNNISSEPTKLVSDENKISKDYIIFNVNNKEFKIKKELCNIWAETYDKEYIESELKKAKAWLITNSHKAPKSNLGRFLNSWLMRSWEKYRTTLKSNPQQITEDVLLDILKG